MKIKKHYESFIFLLTFAVEQAQVNSHLHSSLWVNNYSIAREWLIQNIFIEWRKLSSFYFMIDLELTIYTKHALLRMKNDVVLANYANHDNHTIIYLISNILCLDLMCLNKVWAKLHALNTCSLHFWHCCAFNKWVLENLLVLK